MMLSIVAYTIPSVNILPIANRLPNIGKIVISAIVEGANVTYAQWTTANIPSFSVSKVALTPTSMSLPSGQIMMQLALNSEQMTPGTQYTFQLHASYETLQFTSQFASSSISFTINSPPIGGLFTIEPSSGYSAMTLYYLVTSQWVDDSSDYPLTYLFNYFTQESASSLVIKPQDGVPYTNAYLSQGLKNMNYGVSCLSIVFDTYGSTNNLTRSVVVLPVTASSQLSTLVFIIQNTKFISTDSTITNQIINAVSGSISAVDCTVLVSCRSLNRLSCQHTPRTCGSCIGGYVGFVSDSNSQCFLPSNFTVVGKLCSVDSECSTGFCANGKCADVLKRCSGNCSGSNGDCQFFDNNQHKVQVCYSLDSSCQARCLCNPGYYGTSCSLTLNDFQEQGRYLDIMCDAFYNSFFFQNMNSILMRSRASSLLNLFSDLSKLSDYGYSQCVSGLILAINRYPSLVCDSSTFPVVMKALSLAVETTSVSMIPRDIVANITQSISTIGYYCQNSLAVGEAPTTIVTSNIRLLSGRIDSTITPATAVTLSSAQSDLEKLNKSPVDTLSFNISSFQVGIDIGISITQFNNNPAELFSNSSIIQIQASNINSNNTLRRKLSTAKTEMSSNMVTTTVWESYSVTLQNIQSIEYKTLLPSILVVACHNYSSRGYWINNTCPNGRQVDIYCKSAEKRIYNITCPGYQIFPVCKTWNNAESAFIESPDCFVSNYSSSFTVCKCVGSLRRNLATASDNSYQQFSSSFKVVHTEYIESSILLKPIGKALDLPVITSLWGISLGMVFIGILFTAFHNSNNRKKVKVYAVRDNTALQPEYQFGENDLNKAINENSLGVTDFPQQSSIYSKRPKRKKIKVRTFRDFVLSLIPVHLHLHNKKPFWILCKDALWDHYSLCLVCKMILYYSNENFFSSVLTWIDVFGRLMAGLFGSIFVVYVLFPDDQTCEEVYTKTECEDKFFFGEYSKGCDWNSEEQYCGYHLPQLSPLLMISFVSFGLVIAYIFIVVHRLLISAIRAAYLFDEQNGKLLADIVKNFKLRRETINISLYKNGEKTNIDPTNQVSHVKSFSAKPQSEGECSTLFLNPDAPNHATKPSIDTSFASNSLRDTRLSILSDEFQLYLSKKGKLFRAARITKAIQLIDHVTIQQETLSLFEKYKEYHIRKQIAQDIMLQLYLYSDIQPIPNSYDDIFLNLYRKYRPHRFSTIFGSQESILYGSLDDNDGSISLDNNDNNIDPAKVQKVENEIKSTIHQTVIESRKKYQSILYQMHTLKSYLSKYHQLSHVKDDPNSTISMTMIENTLEQYLFALFMLELLPSEYAPIFQKLLFAPVKLATTSSRIFSALQLSTTNEGTKGKEFNSNVLVSIVAILTNTLWSSDFQSSGIQDLFYFQYIQPYLLYFLCFCEFCFIFLLSYLILSMQVVILSKNIASWGYIVLLILGSYFFIIETSAIILQYVFIERFCLGKSLYRLVDHFVPRMKLFYLRNSFGMLSHSTDLIHHWNISCRIARSFPDMPVSRMLMSLNDADLRYLPNYSKANVSSVTDSINMGNIWMKVRHMVRTMYDTIVCQILNRICFRVFHVLPYEVMEIILYDLFVLLILQGIQIGYYFLVVYSIIGGIVVGATVCGFLISLVLWRYKNVFKYYFSNMLIYLQSIIGIELLRSNVANKYSLEHKWKGGRKVIPIGTTKSNYNEKEEEEEFAFNNSYQPLHILSDSAKVSSPFMMKAPFEESKQAISDPRQQDWAPMLSIPINLRVGNDVVDVKTGSVVSRHLMLPYDSYDPNICEDGNNFSTVFEDPNDLSNAHENIILTNEQFIFDASNLNFSVIGTNLNQSDSTSTYVPYKSLRVKKQILQQKYNGVDEVIPLHESSKTLSGPGQLAKEERAFMSIIRQNRSIQNEINIESTTHNNNEFDPGLHSTTTNQYTLSDVCYVDREQDIPIFATLSLLDSANPATAFVDSINSTISPPKTPMNSDYLHSNKSRIGRRKHYNSRRFGKTLNIDNKNHLNEDPESPIKHKRDEDEFILASMPKKMLKIRKRKFPMITKLTH